RPFHTHRSSDLHGRISSGAGTKLLSCVADARFIGCGALLWGCFVEVMGVGAASIFDPGLCFTMNTPPAGLGITRPNLHGMGG
ncbi:carbon starvation CstA family protein, partial [Salmonella enterica]|uniref:carbon starvation CstA family protein n=1 Tax=Salmonella enterica TaxID=28901 RepID=UPI000B1F8B44